MGGGVNYHGSSPLTNPNRNCPWYATDKSDVHGTQQRKLIKQVMIEAYKHICETFLYEIRKRRHPQHIKLSKPTRKTIFPSALKKERTFSDISIKSQTTKPPEKLPLSSAGRV